MFKRFFRASIHPAHETLHLAYLGAVYIEAHYFYAKIAGALFVCSLLTVWYDRATHPKGGNHG